MSGWRVTPRKPNRPSGIPGWSAHLPSLPPVTPAPPGWKASGNRGIVVPAASAQAVALPPTVRVDCYVDVPPAIANASALAPAASVIYNVAVPPAIASASALAPSLTVGHEVLVPPAVSTAFAPIPLISSSAALDVPPAVANALALPPTMAVKSPILFDNATNGGGGAAATRTYGHAVNGNCIVVVQYNTTATNPTCTYGGVSVPRVAGSLSDGSYLGIYTSYISVFLLISNTLPQGMNNVVINQGATASASMAISFQNVASMGTIASESMASGNINRTLSAVEGAAAVCAYVGGINNFGTLSPNQVLNYNFNAFNTWASVGGWALDSGSGINFAASHSFEKSGFVVPLLPAA